MGTDLETWLKKNIGFDDEWKIEGVDFKTSPLSLDVTVSYVGPKVCPVCGNECARYDTLVRKWRDLDFGSSPCNITAHVPRFDCPVHGVHQTVVPWAGNVSKLTNRFERKCAEYSACMPVHLVSKLTGVRDNTVWSIVRYYTDKAMDNLDLSGMTAFCVDETSSRRGHQYITTFTDPKTGGIVFATADRDSSVLCEFRKWLIAHGGDSDNIKSVCSDMSGAFTKGIRDFFPKAVIVYDPFHVIQAANATLDTVRKTSGLKSSLGRGLRFEFMRNRETLSMTRRERLEAVFDQYFYLGKAYAIKEQLRDFYTLCDYDDAMQFLLGIIDRCMDSDNDDISDLGLTLDKHFWGILEWHRCRMSNGIAEGNNSVIQAMKRSARGFRDTENMMSLIYLRSLKKNGLSI